MLSLITNMESYWQLWHPRGTQRNLLKFGGNGVDFPTIQIPNRAFSNLQLLVQCTYSRAVNIQGSVYLLKQQELSKINKKLVHTETLAYELFIKSMNEGERETDEFLTAKRKLHQLNNDNRTQKILLHQKRLKAIATKLFQRVWHSSLQLCPPVYFSLYFLCTLSSLRSVSYLATLSNTSIKKKNHQNHQFFLKYNQLLFFYKHIKELEQNLINFNTLS